MRHDWTLLCRDVRYNEHGAITLENVLTHMRLRSIERSPTVGSSLRFNRPAMLVSQWTAEFDTDRRVHPATVQLLAPDGETVMREKRIRLDLQSRTAFQIILRLRELTFAGKGTYEFHVLVDAPVTHGEWGRACLTIR